jgi:hypothetical protein
MVFAGRLRHWLNEYDPTMPYIENLDDLQRYREHFGDIWQSAILTFSSVEVDGVHIPNGELKFSREPGKESTEFLYREGAF